MNKVGLFLIFATLAVATVFAGDDDDYYREPQKRINVYVERHQPEIKKIIEYREQPKVIVSEYRQPEVKVIKKIEYRRPEEKKIRVHVVKQQQQDYILKPDYNNRRYKD